MAMVWKELEGEEERAFLRLFSLSTYGGGGGGGGSLSFRPPPVSASLFSGLSFGVYQAPFPLPLHPTEYEEKGAQERGGERGMTAYGGGLSHACTVPATKRKRPSSSLLFLPNIYRTCVYGEKGTYAGHYGVAPSSKSPFFSGGGVGICTQAEVGFLPSSLRSRPLLACLLHQSQRQLVPEAILCASSPLPFSFSAPYDRGGTISVPSPLSHA